MPTHAADVTLLPPAKLVPKPTSVSASSIAGSARKQAEAGHPAVLAPRADRSRRRPGSCRAARRSRGTDSPPGSDRRRRGSRSARRRSGTGAASATARPRSGSRSSSRSPPAPRARTRAPARSDAGSRGSSRKATVETRSARGRSRTTSRIARSLRKLSRSGIGRDWTGYFSPSIQGIIARRSLPTFSTWWPCCSSRMRWKFSWPARFSAIHSLANSPDWMSAQDLLHRLAHLRADHARCRA